MESYKKVILCLCILLLINLVYFWFREDSRITLSQVPTSKYSVNKTLLEELYETPYEITPSKILEKKIPNFSLFILILSNDTTQREDLRKTMLTLASSRLYRTWTYSFVIPTSSSSSFEELKKESKKYGDTLLLHSEYNELILLESISWIAKHDFKFDYILVMDDSGYIAIEKLLVETHEKIKELFWTGEFQCNSDVETPPIFITTYFIISNWANHFFQNNQLDISQYICSKFESNIRIENTRILFKSSCDLPEYSIATHGCSQESRDKTHLIWKERDRRKRPYATDDPSQSCYQGHKYDKDPPSNLFPKNWKFGFYSKLPLCQQKDFKNPVNNPKTYWAYEHYNKEQTKVWLADSSIGILEKQATQKEGQDMMNIYLQDDLIKKSKLIRYEQTRERYWLEMEINRMIVAADIRKETNGNFCVYPNYYSGSRFIFTLAAGQQVAWMKCFVSNIQHLYNYFSTSNVTIGASIAYYYEDENTEYIWDLFQLFEGVTFPYALRLINGKFSRAGGLHHAGFHPMILPTDILLMSDLHLDVPSGLILEGIKHILPNDQMFAPVVVRLGEGADLDKWSSSYKEMLGYGILGCVASDFVQVGGMKSATINKNTWGGEDWHFVDHVARLGFKMHRTIPDRYVHYWHTRNKGTGWY